MLLAKKNIYGCYTVGEKGNIMDLRINSNTSFEARLLIPGQKQSNLMQRVGKEFENITRHLEGDLIMQKPDYISEEERVFEFKYNNASLVSSVENLIPTDAKKVSQTEVKGIAQEFANVFMGLQAQNTYIERMKPNVKELQNAEKELKRLQRERGRLRAYGLFDLFADAFSKNITNQQAKVNKIFSKMDRSYQLTLRQMSKYKDSFFGQSLHASVPEPYDIEVLV